MSVEGRISVDVVFHDRDGTNAVNVVTLAKSDGYSSGKVAIFEGVASTSATSIFTAPSAYRGPNGEIVGIGQPQRIAFLASPAAVVEFGNGIGGDASLLCNDASPCLANTDGQSFWVYTTAGTSSYTLIVYGDS